MCFAYCGNILFWEECDGYDSSSGKCESDFGLTKAKRGSEYLELNTKDLVEIKIALARLTNWRYPDFL